MKSFGLKIISPKATIYDGGCESLTVPGSDGLYGIMANHSPVVMALKSGKVTVKTETEKLTFEITDSVLSFRDNKASIITG